MTEKGLSGTKKVAYVCGFVYSQRMPQSVPEAYRISGNCSHEHLQCFALQERSMTESLLRLLETRVTSLNQSLSFPPPPLPPPRKFSLCSLLIK